MNKRQAISIPNALAGARIAAYLGFHRPAALGGGDLASPAAVRMEYTGHTDHTPNNLSAFAAVEENDDIANWRATKNRIDALKKLDIDTVFHKYPNLDTASALGSEPRPRAGWITRIHFERLKLNSCLYLRNRTQLLARLPILLGNFIQGHIAGNCSRAGFVCRLIIPALEL